MYRRGEDRKRKGGNSFNVPGSRPAEVSRLSWLCKLPRERCSAEGRGGGARGETEEGEKAGLSPPRMRANAQGESIPRAVSSDKVGLGPGRKRKMAPRPLKAS